MAATKIVDTLSSRARENVEGEDHWKHLVEALANPWSPENRDGTAILGLAENNLMHKELANHIKANFDVNSAAHFTYGNGPQGSPRLRKALSDFFNARFHPIAPTNVDEFVIAAGVTAVIDQATWCLCNEGEGLLLPQPLYTGFSNDIPTRSKGRLVPVSFARDDGSLDLDDVFDPEANMRCFERALEQSKSQGVKIKGVMISNPHNPLGKCYSKESILAIMRFCAKHNLHYLSDEIYAMSVFRNESYPDATPFTSVLSIDTTKTIHPELVHVLYGAAKDFCANGLRLGVFHTRSELLRKAVLSIVTFSWEAYIVQDMWSRLLEDHEYLEWFLSENQRRLAKHYAILTGFLDEHGIPYFKRGNAAVFLWVDLRRWFLDHAKGKLADLRVTSPNVVRYREKEDQLNKLCLSKGVMIAKGSNSYSEELGWIRIVFTAEETALRTGLGRFLAALREFEQENGSNRSD